MESMQFALDSWIDADEMKKHISSEDFVKTSQGDIYAEIRA